MNHHIHIIRKPDTEVLGRGKVSRFTIKDMLPNTYAVITDNTGNYKGQVVFKLWVGHIVTSLNTSTTWDGNNSLEVEPITVGETIQIIVGNKSSK